MEWIDRLQPQVVWLSVASGDAGPDLGVLDAPAGNAVWRTNQNVWIEPTTDGEQVWVEVEKQ